MYIHCTCTIICTLPASDLRVSNLCDVSHKEERDLLCKVEDLWEACLQLLDAELGAVLAEERDDAVQLTLLLHRMLNAGILTVGLQGNVTVHIIVMFFMLVMELCKLMHVYVVMSLE